jgi:hypothetical protein
MSDATAAEMILYTPTGYKLMMLVVAKTKRALQRIDMRVRDRLHILEKMNGFTDQWFTPEMLAMIEPMSDTEEQMFREARSLDPSGGQPFQASAEILTSQQVFGHFVRLNASLLEAIKFQHNRRNGTHAERS